MPGGTGLLRCAAVILCLWLVGCAGSGQPSLMRKVQLYYETHATEEGGRCTAPLLEGVTRTQVLSDNAEQMVLDVSYYYRDWIRDGDDCGPLRPLRCTVMRECRGFAQRTFTIEKGQDAFTVVGMSGPQRGRPGGQ
jgi:hypothetical protein